MATPENQTIIYGKLYTVELAYRNPYYGRKTLWKIHTEETDRDSAKKAIVSLMNSSNKPSKAEYDAKHLEDDFASYLKGFYELTFNEDENCYEYYEKEGYDD